MEKFVNVPEELWADICEVLELKRRHAFPDPQYHERVKQLGMEIGFGALMSTASAGWREVADVKGSEFVAGPCQGTIDNLLARIDAFNASRPA